MTSSRVNERIVMSMIFTTVAVFSGALFQVTMRVTTGNLVKTVTFPTHLKLSESAYFVTKPGSLRESAIEFRQ